ncbi:Spc98 family-domain-containing protein [Phakopsora pachyrhizi]|nr:Spc98 family-domain-containing protein [Phakopsora pachyrhizi]
MKHSSSSPSPSSTGLVQEALLILSGHPSSILSSSQSNQTFHPSSIACLSRISSIAQKYCSIHDYAKSIIRSSHSSVEVEDQQHLAQSSAILGLCSSILSELAVYQDLLINLEFRLLSHHPSLVPVDHLNRPAPPLSGIVAEISEWEPIFKGLSSLLNQLDPQSTHGPDVNTLRTGGSPHLIWLTYQHSQTGSPRLSELFTVLQRSVERVWMDSFRSFVIYGECPTEGDEERHSHRSNKSLVNDLFHVRTLSSQADGAANQHLIQFALREDALPALPCLSPRVYLLESIRQICLSLSVLNHLDRPISKDGSSLRSSQGYTKNRIHLPLKVQSDLRKILKSIDGPSHSKFRLAIESVEGLISNYLFTTYLTPTITFKALRTVTDVFLLRHSTLSSHLVQGFTRLRSNRLKIESSLASSSRGRISVTLNDRELDVILLKASLNTDLGDENGPRRALSLEGFKFTLLSDESSHTQSTFSRFTKILLNDAHPTLLTYTPPVGLSLFITPKICETYSKINSCLFAFLLTRHRLQNSLLELIQKERSRSRWVRDDSRKNFKRICFESLRKMTWFIEIMIDHFWQDVIDPSIENILFKNFQRTDESQAGSKQTEKDDDDCGSGDYNDNNLLSGKTFYKTHLKFLVCLKIGLGFDSEIILKDLSELIESINGLIREYESWNFELLPGLLTDNYHFNPGKQHQRRSINEREGEDYGDDQVRMIDERQFRVIEIEGKFEKDLKSFMNHLKQTDLTNKDNKKSGDAEEEEDSSRSRWDDRVAEEGDVDEVEEKSMMVEGLMIRRKCIELLVLRLDFNEWFK